MENTGQRQCRFNGKVGIPALATPVPAPGRLPLVNRFRRQPERYATTLAQTRLIFPPVRHPEFHPIDAMTAGGIMFEWHGADLTDFDPAPLTPNS
jgi:hypothetical protein